MMNTKAAKRLALLVVLVMAVLYLPVSGLATGTKAYTWYGFTVDTDAQYTLVDMNGIQHLYVEKGASVSVAADFFCTGAAGSPTFSWSYLIDSEETAIDCRETTCTITFENEGGLCFTLSENGDPLIKEMIWVHEYGSESEEDVDYYCGMVGTTEMLPLLDYLDAEKFIVDYDGNGSITADELNANIGIDVAVGKGMELVTVSEFQEGDPNGEMSFYYPDAFIKMVSKDAAGEKITFTFTNKKTGASETYEVVVRLADIARGETKIVSTPEGELVQNGYGNYVLMVESGASVTITPGYTTLDGEKADVTINWYILDHEAGRTTEEPLYTGSSYTYTNVQAGRNYGWDVIAKDENGNEYIVETRWVSVQPPVVEYQTVTVKGIPADAVTEELAQIPSLDTPAKIETEVITTVYAKALEKWADVPTENVAAYEVSLVYSEDGLNWEEVNADNWPADLTSLTVRLPYPAGTSAANEFIVAHMFATSVNGKTPGTFEYPAVRKYSDHIEFEVTGLSPISVAWREPVPAAAPNTGDSSTPVLWLLGMLIAGAGCVAMMRKRRQNG